MGTGEDRLTAVPDSRTRWGGESPPQNPCNRTVLQEEVFLKGQGEAIGLKQEQACWGDFKTVTSKDVRLYLSSRGFRRAG